MSYLINILAKHHSNLYFYQFLDSEKALLDSKLSKLKTKTHLVSYMNLNPVLKC